MSEGCIVGKGSFDELIEENGSYAAYYNNVILHDPYSKWPPVLVLLGIFLMSNFGIFE